MSFTDVISQISDWFVMGGTVGAFALIWKLRVAQVDALKAQYESLEERLKVAEATSYENFVHQTEAMKQVFKDELEKKDREIKTARKEGRKTAAEELQKQRDQLAIIEETLKSMTAKAEHLSTSDELRAMFAVLLTRYLRGNLTEAETES